MTFPSAYKDCTYLERHLKYMENRVNDHIFLPLFYCSRAGEKQVFGERVRNYFDVYKDSWVIPNGPLLNLRNEIRNAFNAKVEAQFGPHKPPER